MPNNFFFSEHDITIEIAKKLDQGELKELIPSIGLRKLFIDAIDKEKQGSLLV